MGLIFGSLVVILTAKINVIFEQADKRLWDTGKFWFSWLSEGFKHD